MQLWIDAPDGTTLFVDVTGPEDGPPVVLLHGQGSNHAVWFPQVAALAPTHRVVAYDERGAGRSGGEPGAQRPEVVADDLLAVLDATVGGRPAHLVGHSAGGTACLQVARRHPERVAGLVLADTLGGLDVPAVRPFWDALAARVDAMVAALGDGPMPVFEPRLWRHEPAPDPTLAELYRALASFNRPTTTLPPPMSVLLDASPTADEVAAWSVPTAFVVGEHDDLYPPEVVRAAAAAFPHDVAVHVVAGAWHFPFLEQPAAANAVLLALLG